jgi:hypothetical protein
MHAPQALRSPLVATYPVHITVCNPGLKRAFGYRLPLIMARLAILLIAVLALACSEWVSPACIVWRALGLPALHSEAAPLTTPAPPPFCSQPNNQPLILDSVILGYVNHLQAKYFKAPSFVLPAADASAQCTINDQGGCVKCSKDSKRCLECMNQYGLAPDGTCKPFTVAGKWGWACKKCWGRVLSFCLRCEDSWRETPAAVFATFFGTCKLCPEKECEKCASLTGVCLRCNRWVSSMLHHSASSPLMHRLLKPRTCPA